MHPEFDVDLLRSFVAVVETGSFTKAATTVHRSQAAVSMQIKRLETMLEVVHTLVNDGGGAGRLIDYAVREWDGGGWGRNDLGAGRSRSSD